MFIQLAPKNGDCATDKKRGRGWWALAGVIAGSGLLLLTLYVGAYYWLVERRPNYPGPRGSDSGPAVEITPTYGERRLWRYQRVMHPFFEPIHRVDRRLRPREWDPKLWVEPTGEYSL